MTDTESNKHLKEPENSYQVVASSIVVLISFLAVSTPNPTEVKVYAFLLVAANFAGYIHTCKKDTDSFQRKALTAQSLMISAGFVTVLASAFSSVLQPTQPRNVVIYVSIFALFLITLAPNQVLRWLDMN
ncbi:hypothetical protein GLU26_00585 [Nanohaloarchaea archaeon]|nr:hypothetical protein [Candidatus Nanohaloarchaea archaeon]